MHNYLHPFVKWGQSENFVFLKIDVQDVEGKPAINLHEEGLHFEASGTGTAGKHLYVCDIDFFTDIEPSKSSYRVGGRYIEFHITKAEPGHIWPRLLSENVKPAWLKIDFDHFKFEESGGESGDENGHTTSEMDRIMKELKMDKEEYPVDFKMIYLVLYNLFQLIGYAVIFTKLIFYLFYYGEETKRRTYELVGENMATVLITSALEILHPIFGWVRTDLASASAQVFGRNFAFFSLIYAEPKLQDKEIIFYLFLAWTLIELVRYPFYVFQTVKKDIKILTWLRYTIWIPLYPAGFMCEGILMMLAVPHFDLSEKFCLALPNSLNFAFYFPYFLKFYMLAFLGGMYMLMQRMYEQRKKKLGTRRQKLKAS